MKIHLLVERENIADVASFVVDAVDDNTIDEHGGEYPPSFLDKLGHLNEDFKRRILIVEIPDDALDRVWDIPFVEGAVVDE